MRKIDVIRMSSPMTWTRLRAVSCQRSQARSGPTVPWPSHSPFRRGASMASSL
ncbi:hypothetical protein JG687_00019544 [Phytophthora cactorum]|uniref:Uncharacterized protein n=1 Tax=Phytophthora cactorum TaxID=29920 RepID=A0A8T1TLM8_9STRA|nr:hypothetical protein JG687_00019544 [Phytophthora cactorum]